MLQDLVIELTKAGDRYVENIDSASLPIVNRLKTEMAALYVNLTKELIEIRKLLKNDKS